MLNITPLDRSVNRGAFSCGVEKIDNYLKITSLQEHKKYKMRVFVGTKPATFDVVGFYTLTFIVWSLENVDPDVAAKFTRDGPVPAIYLAKLGVNEADAKQGYGTLLMKDAFNRCLVIAEHAAIPTLTLEAINEEKAKWYEKLGFKRFSPDSLRMVISLATLRQVAK